MTKVPIADIKTNRTLADETGIDDLAQEIKEAGKVEPILLRENLTLIDGLRRLEAVKLLGWSKIDADVTDDVVSAVKVIAKYHANSQPSLRRMYEFHQQLVVMSYLRLRTFKEKGQWEVSKRPKGEQEFSFNDQIWRALGLPYRSIYNRGMTLYKRHLAGNQLAQEMVARLERGELTMESASNIYYDKSRKPKSVEGHVLNPKEQRQLLDVGLRNIRTMITAIETIGNPITVPTSEVAEYATQADQLYISLRRISRRLKRKIAEDR